MAADVIAAAGHAVTIFDRMPSPGRKLLMAGRGGLNLTHSEDLERLLSRYGEGREWLDAAVRAFPPAATVAFARALGEETFVGSSGRVFPTAMKSSPLLRAWLARLGGLGVKMRLRQRWTGVDGRTLHVTGDDGRNSAVEADAVVLALGGASWPRLGSDGAWTAILASWGVGLTPLAASNCGLLIDWTDHFRAKFAGHPLKRVALSAGGCRVRGEAVVTAAGLEGGAVYALTSALDQARGTGGPPPAQADVPVALHIDLRPDEPVDLLQQRLTADRRKASLATWLRKAIALSPVGIGLLHEATARHMPVEPGALARLIKAMPLQIAGRAGLDRAISTRGGIQRGEVDENFMLVRRPGVFVAGEMLDWTAPTGGYLLQACLATGHRAGQGVLAYLEHQDRSSG